MPNCGRKLYRHSLDAQLYGQSRFSCLVDEPVQVIETRLRSECRPFFGSPSPDPLGAMNSGSFSPGRGTTYSGDTLPSAPTNRAVPPRLDKGLG